MITKAGSRCPHDLNHRPLNGWPGKVEKSLSWPRIRILMSRVYDNYCSNVFPEGAYGDP
jgi:hypothetical protein